MKKNYLKRILASVVTISLLAALAGCGSSDNASGESSSSSEGEAQVVKATSLSEIEINSAGVDATGYEGTAAPDGVQAGTSFVFWSNYDIPIYTPWMDNRAAALAYQIYDNLLVKYKGDVNDIRCNIAESYDVSEDGLVWNFKLREDVTFSDGTGLVAQDFIATWDVMQEYQPRPFSSVASYEANGDYELTITLSAPNPTFIYELPTQNIYGVVSHKALEEYGPEDNRSAVGTGPYTVDQYITGEKFVLSAREDYWNTDRQPHIETCEIVIITDENTAMMGIMNGDINCMNTVDIEVMNSLVENEYTVALIEDRENPFWLNIREVEILEDIVVREALCHMLDWDALSELVYDGLYPHPNSYFTGDEAPEYSSKYDYDPELGVKMLEDAGYALTDIEFTFLADPDFTNLEVAMVAQFHELGLTNIQTETYDGATCYGMLKAGTYDSFPVHNGYDPTSPLTPFTMGMLEDGTQPCMFLKEADEAAFDEAMVLYSNAASSSTTEEFYATMTELEDLVQEQCLALGGLQVIRGYAFTDDVRGAYIAPVSAELQFCHLWIAE
ncbi:MAG: ABC transporter substrate-binding protein [Suipraeoptans sp.]